MGKEVLIFFNEVADKNLLQVKCLQKMNLQPVFFVTTPYEKKIPFLNSNHVHYLKSNNVLKRTSYIYRYIKSRKANIRHIEVYPGGRFSFMIVLLSKILSVKCICAERGDLLYYNRNGYDLITRSSCGFVILMLTLFGFGSYIWQTSLKRSVLKKHFFYTMLLS